MREEKKIKALEEKITRRRLADEKWKLAEDNLTTKAYQKQINEGYEKIKLVILKNVLVKKAGLTTENAASSALLDQMPERLCAQLD
jgi:hypothetical protein